MMKNLRRILLSLAISISMGVVSAPSFAGASEAIDNVLVSIINIENAIEVGTDQGEVYKLIRAAIKLSKEIHASDQVAADVSRANGHLKKARGAAKRGELQVAEEHLKKGYKSFENLKKRL